MIDIVFRNETDDQTWGQDFFAPIIEKAVEGLKSKDQSQKSSHLALGVSPLALDGFSLSINLISEENSQELNRQHRGKDKPTNVLSFPVDKEVGDLGDIFICLSIAKNEAKDENISIEHKLAWLTVHGFLHLCGYDHEQSPEAEKEMFDLEKQILEHV